MRRAAEAVRGSIDSAAGLPDFQRELMGELRSMNATLHSLEQRYGRLEALVAHIDEQIPGSDDASVAQKAKDAILGED